MVESTTCCPHEPDCGFPPPETMSTDEFLDLLADGGPCWQEYRESKSSPGGIYVYKGSEESRKHDEAWREYGRLIDAGASLDECAPVLVEAGIWAPPVEESPAEESPPP